MDMYPNDQEGYRQSRVIRAAQYVGSVFRGARNAVHEANKQLASVDFNLGEGMLRSSIAPPEYLPKPPDYPPIHDDTIVTE